MLVDLVQKVYNTSKLGIEKKIDDADKKISDTKGII